MRKLIRQILENILPHFDKVFKFWDGFYIASFLLFGQLLNKCQLMLNIFEDDG
jgi:hypothetical protein